MHNKKLKDFIGSDKRMALVKGYINEYKLTTVLRALNIFRLHKRDDTHSFNRQPKTNSR